MGVRACCPIGVLIDKGDGRRFFHSFEYRAQSWSRPRRVVAKIEWHGELWPRVGFLVTNLRGGAKPIVDFYNQRGTAEQWIKEGKHAAIPPRAAPI